ncbi:uncharacterized protein LOC142488376 [Ascaphus truei]|uniref:uncharacterized protein LOC142488376 n=1 Tax=Ascaphus truei TaxID=8439 RepID=UPI003F5938D4
MSLAYLARSAQMIENEHSVYSGLDEKRVKYFLKHLRISLDKIHTCVSNMRAAADDIDQFHQWATAVSIAGYAGSGVGILLCLVTLVKYSLVPEVGAAVFAAGYLTMYAALYADFWNIEKKCEKVLEMIADFNEHVEAINFCLETIPAGRKPIQSLSYLVTESRSVVDNKSWLRAMFLLGLAITPFVVVGIIFSALIFASTIMKLNKEAKIAAVIRVECDELEKEYQMLNYY